MRLERVLFAHTTQTLSFPYSHSFCSNLLLPTAVMAGRRPPRLSSSPNSQRQTETSSMKQRDKSKSDDGRQGRQPTASKHSREPSAKAPPVRKTPGLTLISVSRTWTYACRIMTTHTPICQPHITLTNEILILSFFSCFLSSSTQAKKIRCNISEDYISGMPPP